MPLLPGTPERAPGELPFGAATLLVQGERFRHSAAKFWSALHDEVRNRFPDATRVSLTAPVPRALSPDDLNPCRDLQELLAAPPENIQRSRESVLAELELLGPPAPIRVRVQDGSHEVRMDAPISDDGADAELLPFLAAWLLQWAQVPAWQWEQPELAGAFTAVDPARSRTYDFEFRVTQVPLSEGLAELCVELALGRGVGQAERTEERPVQDSTEPRHGSHTAPSAPSGRAPGPPC